MSTELWFDSHCHLHDVADADEVIARAVNGGVTRSTFVGTDATTSRSAIALAQHLADNGQSVWSTIGLHPHDASNGLVEIEALVKEHIDPNRTGLLAPGSVVAIGECGLDYFYEHSPKDKQREVFAQQIALANEFHTTLVIHTRDAWDDTFEILQAGGMPERTIIHCFSGGATEARRCLDLGAYLSFSGIVTFKNADAVREAAVLCPADRLLVETDSPFLAPIPHRGRPNEPAYVAIVGAAIAELKEKSSAELAEITTDNAVSVFAVQR